MNSFEKELEIDYMEVCNDLDISSDLGMIAYLESNILEYKVNEYKPIEYKPIEYKVNEYKVNEYKVNEYKVKTSEISESIINKIKKVYDKVIEMIRKIITRIKSIFVKNDQKKIDKLEKSFKANPSLKNKKVKVKDYRKVEKLERDTFDRIDKCKSKEEIKKVQESYSKKRKILLAAIPVVAITGGGILMFLKSKNNKKIKDLESMKSKLSKDDPEKIKAESELIKDINSTLNEIEKEDGSDAVNYLLHEVDLISGTIDIAYKKDEFANEIMDIVKKNPKNKYVPDMYSKLSKLKNSNPEKYKEIMNKLNKNNKGE